MKRFVILSAFNLAACSSAGERQHTQLMQQIEEQVQLPKGAAKLELYDRYYARKGNLIVGRYMVFLDNQGHRYDHSAAQRKWVDGIREVEPPSDGGCSFIRIVYDPKTRIVKALCHGLA